MTTTFIEHNGTNLAQNDSWVKKVNFYIELFATIGHAVPMKDVQQIARHNEREITIDMKL